MSGAVLGDNIIDDLLPVVDDLRGDILPIAGVRQFRVFVVTRTYQGGHRGEGEYTDDATEITPSPAVAFDDTHRFDLRPTGRDEEGEVKISEISLARYVEEDLMPYKVDQNVEFFWRLDDGQGQSIRSRAYKPIKPPMADREKTIGWTVSLRRAEGVQL